MTWDGDTLDLGSRWFKVAPVNVRGERTYFAMVWDDSMGGNYGGHYRRLTEFSGSPSKRTAKQWIERFAKGPSGDLPLPPEGHRWVAWRTVGGRESKLHLTRASNLMRGPVCRNVRSDNRFVDPSEYGRLYEERGICATCEKIA